MSISIKSAVALAAVVAASQAGAEITFYQHEGFNGRSFTTYGSINNLDRYGLNDRASSVVVDDQRYEVCDDNSFRGHCVVLRPGNYPSLEAMGLNNQISSVRPIERQASVDDRRYAPPPVVAAYDYRRRGGEQLYAANVVEVRAIVGPPEQRCWVEKERVTRVEPNPGGAIAGAVIGGILGHQIGAGSGRDLATAGGVVAGAAIGSNVNSRSSEVQRVQHCATTQAQAADYYDVVYRFRGEDHHMQMTYAPGPTVTVNQFGEPRVG